ncbi:unnamed protein product [Fusarium graminearum]|nr:unnamed protein product [Fusarium graminearum]
MITLSPPSKTSLLWRSCPQRRSWQRSRSSTVNHASLKWDLQLKEIERKVDAVCQFLPTAAPTSVVRGESPEDSKPGSDYEKLAMRLHRDLMRGEGFWKTMVPSTSGTGQIEDGMARMGITQGKRVHFSTLPSVNLLRGPNEWIDALMAEALEVDRTLPTVPKRLSPRLGSHHRCPSVHLLPQLLLPSRPCHALQEELGPDQSRVRLPCRLDQDLGLGGSVKV